MAVEAIGRLYAEKFALEIACLRIGSFEERPRERRHLATWVSPRDLAGFVRAALTARGLGFAALYAVSHNTRRFRDLAAGRALGYTPVDDAEAFAGDIEGSEAPLAGPQSGEYTAAEYTLRHLRPR
ncbi:MAG TPA: hypothetical protein VKB80_13810 [Kofleriaceae bacterium]|nr:hypothetical protein [Kofleriaceae bacterium]